MRILIIHCKYREKGGEDVVFQNEYNLLNQSEVVECFTLHNKEGYKGAFQFLISLWNIFSGNQLKKILLSFNPDIVHIHNWHFAIGPIAFRIIKKEGIPLVLTLHNYRLLCPSATLIVNGKLFLHSLNSTFPWKAVQNGVYRNSAFLTFWLGFVVWFHKKIGTWKMIDKYILLTNAAKSLFTNSTLDIPEEKFAVKPNFVNPPDKISEIRGNHFLFVGRLSEEKGIKVLLDAFSNTSFTLHVVGIGPLNKEIKGAGNNIKYLGELDRQGVQMEMRRCSALVFTSIWLEPFGMVLIEAFSLGCPVIASNIGSATELIKNGHNGLLFEAGKPQQLRRQLSFWHDLSETEKENYRKNCIDTYYAHYTPEMNKDILIKIYKSALNKLKN